MKGLFTEAEMNSENVKVNNTLRLFMCKIGELELGIRRLKSRNKHNSKLQL